MSNRTEVQSTLPRKISDLVKDGPGGRAPTRASIRLECPRAGRTSMTTIPYELDDMSCLNLSYS